MLADGVQQVGLAQPHAAVKKERIVGFARRFGHRLGGGKGKIVVRAHDKGFKGVLGIEQQVGVAVGLRSVAWFGSIRRLGWAAAAAPGRPLDAGGTAAGWRSSP